MIPTTVETREKRFQKCVFKVRRVLPRILRVLDWERTGVLVYLISNIEMRRMNGRFRGKRSVTNVLSFPEPKNFPHPEESRKPHDGYRKINACQQFLGEIYLAPDYIADHKEDVVRLLIHGLLHLAGYAHKTERDNIKMEMREKAIFRRLSGAHGANYYRS